MNLTLSDGVKRRITRAASRKGYSSAAEYIEALVEADHNPQRRALERLLLARIKDPREIVMDAADWKQIRRRAEARIRKNLRK